MNFSSTRITTVDAKTAILNERKDASKALVESVERAMKIVEADEDVGCFSCSLFRRFRGSKAFKDPVAATAFASASSSSASGDKAASSATKSMLFGRKKKSDPNAKLREASEAMQERVQQLEYRVDDSKAEAARFMKIGQKAQALRSLKRAKGYEKQVAQNQAALDALEQQVDMLAQAEMQRQITEALSSSSRGLKGNKEILKKAETAIDDATDARDMAEDLNGVMNDFAAGTNNDLDDDELLEELQQMMMEVPPPVPPEDAVEDADAAAAATRELEARHAAWDEAEAVRRALPSAKANGKKKAASVEEKQGLIQAAM